MAEVIKKNYKREPFDIWKVRRAIEYAALQADYPRENVVRLIEKVTDPIQGLLDENGEVSSEEIRNVILSRLEVEEPIVAKEWKLHERIHKTKYVS